MDSWQACVIVILSAALIDGWCDRMRWHWPRWSTIVILGAINIATAGIVYLEAPYWAYCVAAAVTTGGIYNHELWFNDGGIHHKALPVPWYKQDGWHWSHWFRLYPLLICLLIWGVEGWHRAWVVPAAWVLWHVGKGKWNFSTWLRRA